ncbi:MAG: tRNA guanosine(15) transglycosylase TgtA [Candidatus Bathyarchaeota archaeon]|nr:tRNA guanosine(15) transglycosylase TgtA [Candidatus Bathyarchaeota archaeon]
MNSNIKQTTKSKLKTDTVFYQHANTINRFAMSFEVKEKDLLARIGKLKTKTATIETPLLFPVINPSIQPIPTRRLKEHFGFEAIITNAYILYKRYKNQPIDQTLHKFLDFNGAIMTDSGAYQILVYGNVAINQAQIVNYQEQISSDIATILDIPTGWHVKKERAKQTVAETIKRAKVFFKQKTRNDILWVGPVQGGKYLDLVAKSAQAMRKLPFPIHALGSPTEVMESYRYDVLVDMIMTAKMNLPPDRPLHLFGAGHPHMMALATALGCDLFDSAAYALYARENRYMTENGTWRLEELSYFPCQCPKCASSNPKAVLELPKKEKEIFLAEHNLHVCVAELKRIKQSIRDGRLWEHVEMRAHAHPTLLSALKRVKDYRDFVEKYSPATKPSGLFFFGAVDLPRPEVVRHEKRLRENYLPPENVKVLLLTPQTRTKPFQKSVEFKKIRQVIARAEQNPSAKKVHVCFYVAPFGVVPIELTEVYPLSQHEAVTPLDQETILHVARQVGDYIKRANYQSVVLINDSENWNSTIQKACKAACKNKNVPFVSLTTKVFDRKDILTSLENILKNNLSE